MGYHSPPLHPCNLDQRVGSGGDPGGILELAFSNQVKFCYIQFFQGSFHRRSVVLVYLKLIEHAIDNVQKYVDYWSVFDVVAIKIVALRRNAVLHIGGWTGRPELKTAFFVYRQYGAASNWTRKASRPGKSLDNSFSMRRRSLSVG